MKQLTGPIPGENFTSDTKNYPWHRPPEFTDLDKALDMVAKRLMSEESSVGILTMLQTGVDIATVTDMFVTSGIGGGKWTPDFALLLAGPVSHIIYLMAKGSGIEPDLGIESRRPTMTKAFFDGMKVDQQATDRVLAEITSGNISKEQTQAQLGGFMGAQAPAAEVPMEEQGVI